MVFFLIETSRIDRIDSLRQTLHHSSPVFSRNQSGGRPSHRQYAPPARSFARIAISLRNAVVPNRKHGPTPARPAHQIHSGFEQPAGVTDRAARQDESTCRYFISGHRGLDPSPCAATCVCRLTPMIFNRGLLIAFQRLSSPSCVLRLFLIEKALGRFSDRSVAIRDP